jgi:hypothetical protein
MTMSIYEYVYYPKAVKGKFASIHDTKAHGDVKALIHESVILALD